MQFVVVCEVANSAALDASLQPCYWEAWVGAWVRNLMANEAYPNMTKPLTIIVIGASTGGVDAIRTIVAGLPADLNAAVLVTLHIGSHRSELPGLLTRAGVLPASQPIDGEKLSPRHIYAAPPDHHMLVEEGLIKLTKGPRENWARPAIDPLFRSAARAYGPNVIGVILTGALNDGTAGMFEIKAQGGTTVVQDPSTAFNPSMPQSVLDNITVDHVAPIEDIGALLTELVSRSEATPPRKNHSTGDSQERGMTAEFTLNKPVAITCPDCGGALREGSLGELTQFSCHIGHVYTAEVVIAAQFLMMERSLETAMRSLSERAELCRQMREKLLRNSERGLECADWAVAREEALDRTGALRQLLTSPWVHPGGTYANQRRDKSP